MSLSSKFKLAVRKLFSKAFGFKFVAGISTIKLVFPNFFPNDDTYWYCLIDRCNARLELMADTSESAPVVEQKPVSKLAEIKNTLSTLTDVFTVGDDWLGEFTSVVVHGLRVGQIGWSQIRQAYYFGNRSHSWYFPSINGAVNAMLARCAAM
jgi:hypothetical protein